MKSRRRLTIIIPIYNEKDCVIELIKKVNDVPLIDIEKEIIAIDDCSTDGTRKILDRNAKGLVTKMIFHEENQGKGAAIRTGIKEATGDVIIIQDADLEYDPTEYPMIVGPIFRGEADVVYGSRFINSSKVNGYKENILANRALTLFSNIVTGLRVTDMETCYKAFRTDIVKKIKIVENRFGFEPEVTAKLGKMGVKLIEVPISYYPRTKEQGKKIKFKDGLRAIYCILKYGYGK